MIEPGRIGIVGLGLIGGSFARALYRGPGEIYAWNRNRDVLEMASIDAIDGELTDEIVGTCELIILTTYPAHSLVWFKEHAHLVSPEAITIDACGTKRKLCREAQEIAASHNLTFVGAHPMAGTQYSGFAHAKATLFEGAPLVLCPPELEDLKKLDLLHRIRDLLAPCGFASATVTTPEEHDRIIAYTSQLAHVVSSAYVKSPTALEQKGFSAGSWRDLTRVASLNAPMWSELFLENADYLVAEVDEVIAHLQEYRDVLAAGDRAKLEALLDAGTAQKQKADAQ